MQLAFTGKFQISLQEIENGYRCGTITHKDGAIFMGKYWENKDTGITKWQKAPTLTSVETRKFWENSGNDGILWSSDINNIARVIPYD